MKYFAIIALILSLLIGRFLGTKMKGFAKAASKALGKMRVIIIVKSPEGRKSRAESIKLTESAAEILAEHLEHEFELHAVNGRGNVDGTKLVLESDRGINRFISS